MKVSYYNWHFKGRGQYTNAFIETLYLTVLVDYSRVPNSRRGWNNRKRKGGGGNKDVLGGKKIEKLAIGGGEGSDYSGLDIIWFIIWFMFYKEVSSFPQKLLVLPTHAATC